jgi:hypothetical protein
MIVAALAVAAFVVAFVVASRGDDDDDVRAEADLEGLDALTVEARELVALADQGRQVTFHAVYEQRGGDRFEVWTDGVDVREETTPAEGERRLLLRLGEEAVDCVEDDDGWTCEEPTEPSSGVQGRIEQLVADLAGAEVAPRDGTIAGTDVRCFAITTAEGPLEICLTMAGVLARLEAGDARLELVSLDDEVDDDVFEVPG